MVLMWPGKAMVISAGTGIQNRQVGLATGVSRLPQRAGVGWIRKARFAGATERLRIQVGITY